jgi:hypothetical protein
MTLVLLVAVLVVVLTDMPSPDAIYRRAAREMVANQR